jgi:hypothetical protein
LEPQFESMARLVLITWRFEALTGFMDEVPWA